MAFYHKMVTVNKTGKTSFFFVSDPFSYGACEQISSSTVVAVAYEGV